MKKILLFILLIPLFGLAQVRPTVDAGKLQGLDSTDFVTTHNTNQTVLGAKDFTGTLSFDGVAFPDGDGTVNQVMVTDAAGQLSFASIAGFSGLVGLNFTNIDAIQLFTATDTTTVTGSHSHNEYMLTFTKAYGTMGFADSSFSIPMTQNIYYPITNTANTLYITGVNYGLTFAGDSIQVPEDGNYEIEWDLSYSGANTDLYHIEIFVDGVSSKGKGEGQRDMSSSNIGSSSGHTILSLTALQWITLRIENTINNNDATVYAGNIVINKK